MYPPPTAPLTISVFASAFETSLESVVASRVSPTPPTSPGGGGPGPALFRFLDEHRRECERKDQQALWSPAEYLSDDQLTPNRNGGYRHGNNVRCCHAIVFDLDDLEPQNLLDLIEHLHSYRPSSSSSAPPEFILYSSHSHTPEKPKARVVFFPDRPIAPSAYQSLHHKLAAELLQPANIHPDSSTAFPNALYYLPSNPPSSSVSAFLIHSPGNPLQISPDAATGLSEPHRPMSPPAPSNPRPAPDCAISPTLPQLQALADRLQAQTSAPAYRQAGIAIDLALQGLPFALSRASADLPTAPLGRHATLTQIAHRVAENWPYLDPLTTADYFTESITASNLIEPDARPIEANELPRLLEHAQDEHLPRHEEDQAFLAHLDKLAKPSPTARAANAWILNYKDNYYVRVAHAPRDDDHRPPATPHQWEQPVSRASLFERCSESWSRAPDTPSLYIPKADGEGYRKATAQELMVEYGTFVEEVVAEIGGVAGGRWDPGTKTLYEGVCVPRGLQPTHDPLVDQWLQLFGGDTLLDWLALCPDLDKPLVALYIGGERGTGKSLLVEGITRIWSEGGSTRFDDAMATNFNDSTTRCPFVFADEHTRSSVYNTGTGEIRDFIAKRTRTLRRKYRPTATLKGCMRLAFAANNLTMLRTSEQLTRHDMAAVAERFLLLEPPHAARRYLEELEAREPEYIQHHWIEGDAIAKHVLHLAATRQVARTTRFGIRTDPTRLINAMTDSGHTGQICTWLISALQNPVKTRKGTFYVGKGRIVVNTTAVLESWATKMPGRQPLTSSAIGAALTTLSVDGKARQIRVKPSTNVDRGHRVYGFEIDVDRLAEYAANNGILEVEGVKALTYPTTSSHKNGDVIPLRS